VTPFALALFALGWLPVFRYRSEHVQEALAAAAPGMRRWIPLTIAAVSLHVTLCEVLLTWQALGTRAASGARVAIGCAVFVAGLAWWAWARGRLGPFDRPLDPASPPAALIVRGPFAVVRHPLALGTLVAALGPALAVGSLAWLSFAAVALCLAERCKQDEVGLHAAFGAAYDAYAARTRRLVPFLW
jgi:protein-S-isoprenylcysteine O-methyltransferase Ste14